MISSVFPSDAPWGISQHIHASTRISIQKGRGAPAGPTTFLNGEDLFNFA